MSPNISTTFAGTIVTFQKYPKLVTLLVSLVRRGRISSIFKSLHLFFKNMGQPRPLFHLFSSFQINITIFIADIYGKMSIKYMELGFKLTTFEHDTPPMTNRPGLPPTYVLFVIQYLVAVI